MNKSVIQKKWDRIACFYKWINGAAERRWEPWKSLLFSKMGAGNILFLAIGIGDEIRLFPENRQITAIDISPRMLEKAGEKAVRYNGSIWLMEMDARALNFPSEIFDQVFSSCTFCSVPEPVLGLKELYRVLKPGGRLFMFEHTRSKYFPFREILWMMNPVAERLGPSVTRDTEANVRAAGFTVDSVQNIYLDIVKIIEGGRP